MNKEFDYQIITNNPTVKNKYKEVIFVEGYFEDVLYKTRDLIHMGYELINHPLGASIRMFFSPYRSIIISKSMTSTSDEQVLIMENSIESYKTQMGVRKPDIANSQDYALIDSELLKSSIEEMNRFFN